MASDRTIHLPPVKTKLNGAPPAADGTQTNPVLLFGSLMRDHAVIAEKLKGLHLDEGAYHGNLQVMLSAIRRMERNIETMINAVEG